MVTPDAKRKAVVHACEVHGVSQRRACQALRIDRSTVRYTSIRADDAPLREVMKAVAAERWRFGYRRIHVMLGREGIVMNQKKLRRLYRAGARRKKELPATMLALEQGQASYLYEHVGQYFWGRRE
jgi:putative transposase